MHSKALLAIIEIKFVTMKSTIDSVPPKIENDYVVEVSTPLEKLESLCERIEKSCKKSSAQKQSQSDTKP